MRDPRKDERPDEELPVSVVPEVDVGLVSPQTLSAPSPCTSGADSPLPTPQKKKSTAGGGGQRRCCGLVETEDFDV